jgi:hypothetical protein
MTVAGDGADDDDASTRGMVSPSQEDSFKVSLESEDTDRLRDSTPPIPTIRISTESDRERNKLSDAVAEMSVNGQPNGVSQHDSLEKPVQAAAGGDASEQDRNEASALPTHEPFSFSNKRLCERWLDNLFMVLYEV